MTITSDERDLAGRLCRALDITARSLTLFSERGYTDTEVTENSFRPDKPIAEAAMLVYASSGLDDYPGVAERRYHLAGVVASFARSPRVALSMALHPSACVEFAVPHILLTKMGFPDEQFDRLLTVGLDSEAASGHERPPFA